MVAWLFLTFGISLGAHWAYAVLGWADTGAGPGRKRFPAPVAFPHCFPPLSDDAGKARMMKVWNVWLIFITFMLPSWERCSRAAASSAPCTHSRNPVSRLVYRIPGNHLRVCLVFYIKNTHHLRSENKLESRSRANPSFMSTTCCCWAPALLCCAELYSHPV